MIKGGGAKGMGFGLFLVSGEADDYSCRRKWCFEMKLYRKGFSTIEILLCDSLVE